MKFNALTILFISFFVVCNSTPCMAVSEAGEIQRKETKEPKSNMYVSNNIADLGFAATAPDNNEVVEKIEFEADEMINDEKSSTLTAQGNVEIRYNGMRLTTDKLVYNQDDDTVVARGNTTLYSPDGAVVKSTYVNLADSMSEICITLRLYSKTSQRLPPKDFAVRITEQKF